MNIRNDDFFNTFIMETKSHLESMENNLLELDHADSKQNLLQEIYRSAHTIKGSSSIIKCDIIKDIVHNIENIIQVFINSKSYIDTESVDHILLSCDLINNILEDLDNISDYENKKKIICKDLDNIFVKINNSQLKNISPDETSKNINQKKRKLKNYLIFKTGGNLYTVPLFFIREILSEISIKPINFLEEYILGLINYHGEIIPVIDINRRFNLFSNVTKKITDEKKVIIFMLKDMLLGIRIDNPTRIFAPEKLSFEKEDNIIFRSFCDSRYCIGNEIVHSVNINILFTRDNSLS